MARWNTEEIKNYLESLGCKITHIGPGEDYTTDSIGILLDGVPEETDGTGNSLHLRGFATRLLDDDLPRSDCDVPMMEIYSGYSDGGCVSKDEKTCVLYGKLLAHFRQEGFVVVPHMKEYF
jgi:hypothetical protein